MYLNFPGILNETKKVFIKFQKMFKKFRNNFWEKLGKLKALWEISVEIKTDF